MSLYSSRVAWGERSEKRQASSRSYKRGKYEHDTDAESGNRQQHSFLSEFMGERGMYHGEEEMSQNGHGKGIGHGRIYSLYGRKGPGPSQVVGWQKY